MPDQVKGSIDGTLTYRDGTAAPVELVSAYERGDFQCSGISKVLNEPVKHLRRGRLMGVGFADRKFPQVSFTVWLPRPNVPDKDFLLQQGTYLANVSTMGAGSRRPYTIDLVWAWEGTDYNEADDYEVVFENFFPLEVSVQEALEGNVLSVSGEVWGDITGDIEAAELVAA